jgi:hypothetical protein
MNKATRLILVGAVSTLSVVCLGLARANQNSDIELEADINAVGSSGVSGTATVDISDDGLRGKLKARGLMPSHGYTTWFFYLEGTSQGGPGRFDSEVAESSEVTFRGHVGGLQVSSGAKIRLFIFDHPDLTKVPVPPVSGPCTAISATNVARANNLLTPQCGSLVGSAEFTVP